MINKKLTTTIFLAASALFGYWKLKQNKWYVLNEKEHYVHLLQQSQKPTVAVVLPVDKNMWPTIFNLTSLSSKLSDNGRVAVVLPMKISSLLDTMNRVKQTHKLDIDVYLAPERLWNKLAKNEQPTYLFIKNGSIVKEESSKINWLSYENIKMANKVLAIK